jgi:integrase
MPFLTDAIIQALPLPAKGNKVHFDQPDPNIPETTDVVTVGLGLRVTAAGHRAWVFRYRLRDGSDDRRKLTLGRYPHMSVATARKRARKLREEIEGGADPQGEKAARRQEPTVGQLGDDFMAACVRKVKAEMMRQGTVYGYERALRLHIRPHLGKLRITAITKKTVKNFHEAITLDGKRVQANRSVAILSTMMSWAVEQELLATNPCIKAVRFNTEEPRAREIAPEECERFVAELAKHDTQSAKAIRILLLTGARRTEVTSIRWSDLVLDGKDPEWRRKGSRLKGKRDHTVPLSPPAQELLVAIRNETIARDGAVTSPFVFPSDTVTGYTDIRRMWLLIMRRTGITDLTPHDLRHHFASVLASSGSSVTLIAAMLAHASPASSHRYMHAFRDAKREATERVAATIMAPQEPAETNVHPLHGKRGA